MASSSCPQQRGEKVGDKWAAIKHLGEEESKRQNGRLTRTTSGDIIGWLIGREGAAKGSLGGFQNRTRKEWFARENGGSVLRTRKNK